MGDLCLKNKGRSFVRLASRGLAPAATLRLES